MNAIIEELKEFNLYHIIFTDNHSAIEFMVKHMLILPCIPCVNEECMGIMHIQNISFYSERRGYRCNKKQCKRTCSLKRGTKFNLLHMECRKILRCMFCWVFSYRKWETMVNVFNEHICSGSILVTDGYPSYPRSASVFGSVHEIVNHSMGFVNETGGNTNAIENLWSHLKQDYRRRGGINHERISIWLDEFSWKKRNINYSQVSTVKMAFIELILRASMIK